MKNIYIRPTTECYNTETTQIIASSIPKDKENQITNPDEFDFLSRENDNYNPQNLWDNEW